RDQGPLRPDEPLPPEPEHPAGRRVVGAVTARRDDPSPAGSGPPRAGVRTRPTRGRTRRSPIRRSARSARSIRRRLWPTRRPGSRSRSRRAQGATRTRASSAGWSSRAREAPDRGCSSSSRPPPPTMVANVRTRHHGGTSLLGWDPRPPSAIPTDEPDDLLGDGTERPVVGDDVVLEPSPPVRRRPSPRLPEILGARGA